MEYQKVLSDEEMRFLEEWVNKKLNINQSLVFEDVYERGDVKQEIWKTKVINVDKSPSNWMEAFIELFEVEVRIWVPRVEDTNRSVYAFEVRVGYRFNEDAGGGRNGASMTCWYNRIVGDILTQCEYQARVKELKEKGVTIP